MEVVREIRRNYEVDEPVPSVLSECAEHALELLADQLYTTDTHFLLEFVQNAEDNEYPKYLKPTLRIVIEDSSMTLSCNEIGFSKENVLAICKIGASTKKNISGFIGEKGIGFKSVFKVADMVHVASGPYTFKFDRRQRLGMIAPIWDSSIPSIQGWTAFNLSLSPSSGVNLSTKLLEIKPSLLLFLKKLRSIELNVGTSSCTTSKMIKIERNDLKFDVVELTRVDNGTVRSRDRYYISKSTVDMSAVHKSIRRGAERTEIVLAFPLDEGGRPRISPQDVHAFLPIRKFGFNFVIHGDFLTSSSREDILNDSHWNLSIRDAIVDTFVAAIPGFQTLHMLQDTWIRYLPTGILEAFFSPVERNLLAKLRTMEIVKDRNEIRRRPDDILHVPSVFCYKARPLITEDFMKQYYLSEQYSSADIDMLERLGVREMTWVDFLDGLAAMDSRSLQARDNEWHEKVCYELIRIRSRYRAQFYNRTRNVKLLPLDNGCRARACDANDGNLSLQAHVSNAAFFFSHRSSQPALPSPAGRLRIIDGHGAPCTGEQLYLELPIDGGMLRRSLSPSVHFIHSEYARQFEGEERDYWLQWLRDQLRLNTAPRLISSRLSPEFKEMVERLSLSEFFHALRYFWSRWPIHSTAPWHEELRLSSVKLSDGSQCSIGSMYLKRRVLAKYSGIPFVPVDDPDSKEWDFLGRIGVTVEVDATFFVKLLIRYQSQEINDENTVRSIYKQLDARFDEDEPHIHEVFREHPLVYVPSKLNKTSWKFLSDVYWDGPSSMTSKVALRLVYPNLKEFFQDKLRLSNAPPSIVIDELMNFAKDWTSKTITNDAHKKVTDTLVVLSRLVETARLEAAEVRLLVEEHAIFPARYPSSELQLGKLADIYIPDRVGYYADIFKGKVPLLELARNGHHPGIDQLLSRECSGDLARLLESSVDHRMVPRGPRKFVEELTAKYTSRYDAFERIVYHKSKPSDRQVLMLSKVKEITIFMVDSICSTFSLADLTPISVDNELLQLSEEEHAISIFVSRSIYAACPRSNRVHIDICKRLGDALGCAAEKLFTYVVLGADDLEYMLQLQGVDNISSHQPEEDAWLQSSVIQTFSSVHSPNSTAAHQPAYHTHQISGVISTGGVPSQSTSAVEELGLEVERFMDCLCKLSASSIRVVNSTRSTSRQTLDLSSSIASRHTQPSTTEELVETISSQQVMSATANLPAVFGSSRNASTSMTIPSLQSSRLLSRSISFSSHPSPYQEVNGVLGERYAYELLLATIGPTFGPDNWTSELRGLNPGFDDYEGSSLADFTYDDKKGILTKHLYKEDPEVHIKREGAYPTYHIEVKSTSSGSREPFSLSRRQFATALALSQHNEESDGQRHIYVIIRVWNVKNPTPNCHTIYVDPIRCIVNDDLKVLSEKIELMIGG